MAFEKLEIPLSKIRVICVMFVFILTKDYFRICDRCLASAQTNCPDSMNFRNLTSSKAWHLTSMSHEQYALLDSQSLSPWMALPGFRLESVSFDWLHNIYLGHGRDLFASGLLTLVEQGVYSYSGLTDTNDLLAHAEERIRKKCFKHRPLFQFSLHFVCVDGIPNEKFMGL